LRLSAELRATVVLRANSSCECCLLHDSDAAFPHEVDHVVSRKHGGQTTANNLAYACMICNRYKGSNIASLTGSGDLIRLFNPRQDRWIDHFRLNGPVVEPLDEIGEVTARVLRLNSAERVVRRGILQQLRRYPRS